MPIAFKVDSGLIYEPSRGRIIGVSVVFHSAMRYLSVKAANLRECFGSYKITNFKLTDIILSE